jgi:predicted RNase H-like HicB family nuclease
MSVYPLFFGVRDAVAGRGFLAGVAVTGRAVLEFEDGRWWVSGVEPGGIVGDGETPEAAYANFRESLRLVLYDSAHLANSFDDFRTDVEALARQSNDAADARWAAARQLVRQLIRAGAPIEAPFAAELPRLTKDVKCGAQVVRLDESSRDFKPQQNKQDRLLTAA